MNIISIYCICFSINLSLNSSKKVLASSSFTSSVSGKTPTKRSDGKTKKTPSKSTKKSPSKIISISSKYRIRSFNFIFNNTGRVTPAKTPNGGDRFIPSRSTTNFELSHYKVRLDRYKKVFNN